MNWWNFSIFTYVKLVPTASDTEVEARFTEFMKSHMPPMGFEDPLPTLQLQPIRRIHLYSDFEYPPGQMGPRTYVYLFIGLACLIMVIACINFVNLSTARSQDRAREVGVRKVTGAKRGNLVRQFLAESIVVSFIALMVAVGWVELLMPVFQQLSGKVIEADYMNDGVLVCGFIGIAVVAGMGAGLYPALFLSRFQPAHVLKGVWRHGSGRIWFRRILVTFQFAISVSLIFGTLVVYAQLSFLRTKNLGFDKERVVLVPLSSDGLRKSAQALKTALLGYAGVDHVTLTSSFPYGFSSSRTGVVPEGMSTEDRRPVFTFQTDFDYFATLDVPLVAGRFLNSSLATDTGRFIINEAAVKDFGWTSPAKAVGKEVTWLGHGLEHAKKGTVVGVVRDFHFRTLHETIQPAIFHVTADPYRLLAVRIRPGETENILEVLRNVWAQFEANHPFEFEFLEQRVDQIYKTEEKLGHIFGVFSILAIVVACMGLFGLAAFLSEKRSKEIGIRKVMGASVVQIVRLLSTETILLAVFSCGLALPIVGMVMTGWLEDFPYRTSVGFGMFAIPSALLFAITLLTVGYQSYRASTANPVQALKYE